MRNQEEDAGLSLAREQIRGAERRGRAEAFEELFKEAMAHFGGVSRLINSTHILAWLDDKAKEARAEEARGE